MKKDQTSASHSVVVPDGVAPLVEGLQQRLAVKLVCTAADVGGDFVRTGRIVAVGLVMELFDFVCLVVESNLVG